MVFGGVMCVFIFIDVICVWGMLEYFCINWLELLWLGCFIERFEKI